MPFREQSLNKHTGFGLIGLIIVIAVIALATGGGFYFKEKQAQKSLIEIGLQKEKEAEALKEKIQNRYREELDQSIRKIDFKKYFEETLGYKKMCSDTFPPDSDYIPDIVRLEPIQYADLNGDMKEEAVVGAFSCMSGTGGPDILGVYGLDDSDKIIELEIDNSKTFNGQNIYDKFGGHTNLTVENGNLVKFFPLYNKDDPNCCPTGGSRRITHGWDGMKFVIVKVEDLPFRGSN